MRTLALAVTLITLALACAGGTDENEVRLFLERYDAVQRADEAQRASRVQALRELPILSDDVRRVRDRCVEVQLATMRAQRYHDEVAARADALEDGGTVTEADQRELAALLARAEAAIDTANAGKNACLDGVSRLSAHYGRRR